jgi:ATP-dependent exoDNAse (exonuclease V) alpha subunit
MADVHSLSYKAQIVQRSSGGKQVVAGAAYMLGAQIYDDREGRSWSYKKDAERVVASGFVQPEGVPSELTADAGRFWNAVEAKEDNYNFRRWKDPAVAEAKCEQAQTALAGHVSIANDLSLDDAKRVAEELCERQFAERGMVAQWAIHWDHGNHHIHFQGTARKWKGSEVGARAFRKPDDLSAWHSEFRATAAEIQNRILAERGLDVHVEHRSNKERGITQEAGVHVGPVAGAMIERGEVPRQVMENEEIARRNREAMEANSAITAREIVATLTRNEAFLTEAQIARTVFNFVGGEPEIHAAIMPVVMADDRLEKIGTDLDGKAVYTTREYRQSEGDLFAAGRVLDKRQGVRITADREALLADKYGWMNAEQKAAVLHLTSGKGLVLVEGVPGSGKTTAMKAAREIWEKEGRRIEGAAVAWRAAKTLEADSGIKSRSVAAIIYGIERREHLREEVKSAGPAARRRDRNLLRKIDSESLGKGDVLLIDEAGMIDVRSMAIIMKDAAERGYTVAAIGDRNQFQAIGAGRAFGGLVDEFGCARLDKVNRQGVDAEDVLHHVVGLSREAARRRADTMSRAERIALVEKHAESVVVGGGAVWRREAAEKFAAWDTRAALEMLHQRGFVEFQANVAATKARIVDSYFKLRDEGVTRQAIYTFTNADCDDLNSQIKGGLRERGEIGEDIIQVGERHFAAGDRVMFTESQRRDDDRFVNEGDRVVNGDLGRVVGIWRDDDDRAYVSVGLDGERLVHVRAEDFAGLRHAWAMTEYKSQGATVGGGGTGHVHIFASRFDDAAAAAVAGTRSRDDVTFYANQQEFEDVKALADSMRRVKLKTLVRDVNRDPERDGIVRQYKAAGRDIAELTERIDAETPDDGKRIDHPEYGRLAELAVERKRLATVIAGDRAGYQTVCQRGRISWEQIEVAAGRRDRPLSDASHAIRAQMVDYAAKRDEARDLWNAIKAGTSPRMVKQHSDYGRFDALRQERDAMAAEIVAAAKVARSFKAEAGTITKDAGVSWRSINTQAQQHAARLAEAERLANLPDEQRQARDLVQQYREARREAAALGKAGDPGARETAQRRDRLAAAVLESWKTTGEWAAESGVDDHRLEAHARAAEARDLVKQYAAAAQIGDDPRANQLAAEIMERHRQETGRHAPRLMAAALRDAAEAGRADWRTLRRRAEAYAAQERRPLVAVEVPAPARKASLEEIWGPAVTPQPKGVPQAVAVLATPQLPDGCRTPLEAYQRAMAAGRAATDDASRERARAEMRVWAPEIEKSPDLMRRAEAAGLADQVRLRSRQVEQVQTTTPQETAQERRKPALGELWGSGPAAGPAAEFAEPAAEFAEALRKHGLIIKGQPVMDGQWHRVAVDGDKEGALGGSYRVDLDGRPTGHIMNYKTMGAPARWEATGTTQQTQAAQPEAVENDLAVAARILQERQAAEQAQATTDPLAEAARILRERQEQQRPQLPDGCRTPLEAYQKAMAAGRAATDDAGRRQARADKALWAPEIAKSPDMMKQAEAVGLADQIRREVQQPQQKQGKGQRRDFGLGM